DLGFIRPRNQLEWQFAYCQALLYVEHIQKKYGPKAIGKLLAAFAEGHDTASALREACDVDKETFEKDYRAHLEEVVRPMLGKKKGEKARKPRTIKQLKADHKKKPEDPDIAGELALRL